MRETIPLGGHHIFDKVVARRLVRFYQRIVIRNRTARDIVDVGCGPGHFAANLAAARPEATVTGLDLDPRQVALAKRYHDQANLTFRVGASHASGLPDASTDWVLATETFHHWSLPRPSLVEIHRALRPGGEFWIIEGDGDMTNAEIAAWTGRRPWPGLGAWIRFIFRRHGYRADRLQRDVVAVADASPFGGAEVSREDGWWIVRLQKQ